LWINTIKFVTPVFMLPEQWKGARGVHLGDNASVPGADDIRLSLEARKILYRRRRL
jgi:hypothetical protein